MEWTMMPHKCRLCLWCEHFNYDSGWGGTDVTPGDAPECECRKGHWELNGEWHGIGDLRQAMVTAESCPDYQVAKGLNFDAPS